MNTRVHLVAWALGIVLLTSLARADIPQVISYQGKVTDAAGVPIADGSYTMRFVIYDAVSAGTLQWDSGDCSVTVAGGVFKFLPEPTSLMLLGLAGLVLRRR